MTSFHCIKSKSVAIRSNTFGDSLLLHLQFGAALRFLYVTIHFREAVFFGFRQLKVAEMSGRAPKKLETARKRNAGAADDQDFSKIARPKKRNFRPLETNGRADGNRKKPSLVTLYGHFLTSFLHTDKSKGST